MKRQQRRAWRRDIKNRQTCPGGFVNRDQIARTNAVLMRVFAERVHQVDVYGDNAGQPDGTGPSTMWAQPIVDLAQASYSEPIDATVVERVLREAYEDYDAEAPVTWVHLVLEEIAESFKEDDPERLQEELIQVAALCVSWVEQLTIRGRILPVEEGYR